MAKLLAFALLLAALFIAAAAVHTATTTTVAYDDDNEENSNMWQQSGGRCRQKIQAQQLSRCLEYLTSRASSSSSYTVLRMRRISDDNPQKNQKSFDDCCYQLWQLQDRPCRCDGVREVMREMVQQGQLQGMQLRDSLEMAKYLPPFCVIDPRPCQVSD